MSRWINQVQNQLAGYLATTKPAWSRYGLACVLTLLACYIVYQIRIIENVQMSAVIMAATIFAAAHGGVGPATVSTVLGTAFIEVWLIGSPDPWPTTIAEILRILSYLLVSLGVSLLVILLRKSFSASEAMRRKAEAVNRENDAILSIVAHDLKKPYWIGYRFF